MWCWEKGVKKPCGHLEPLKPAAAGPMDEAEETVTCPEWKSAWATKHADPKTRHLYFGDASIHLSER